MSQEVIILRGLPGAGKSRRAGEISETHHRAIDIVSADLYFIRPDGAYAWNGAELANAHEWCFQEFRKAISKGHSVVVDNTNMRYRDFAPYVEYANRCGVPVTIETVGSMPASLDDIKLYASRNTHGVSEEGIFRMNQRWQP